MHIKIGLQNTKSQFDCYIFCLFNWHKIMGSNIVCSSTFCQLINMFSSLIQIFSLFTATKRFETIKYLLLRLLLKKKNILWLIAENN